MLNTTRWEIDVNYFPSWEKHSRLVCMNPQWAWRSDKKRWNIFLKDLKMARGHKWIERPRLNCCWIALSACWRWHTLWRPSRECIQIEIFLIRWRSTLVLQVGRLCDSVFFFFPQTNLLSSRQRSCLISLNLCYSGDKRRWKYGKFSG